MSKQFRSSSLAIASITYLALPHFIFMLGWLRGTIGIPLAGFLLASLLFGTGRVGQSQDRPDSLLASYGIKPTVLLTTIPLSIFLTLICGVGGIGPQHFDWFKHNAVLRELIDNSWPPIVWTPEGGFPLVYYTAWYLPPALCGKLGGWSCAQYALMIWNIVGLTLALAWVFVLIPHLPALGVIVFVLFSGLDVIGGILVRLPLGTMTDWWAAQWLYGSNVFQLFNSPYMGISGWMLTALVLHEIWTCDERKTILLVFGLSFLWSPFLSLGLTPYLAADFMTRDGFFRSRASRYLSPANLAGILLAALYVSYFASKNGDLPFKGNPYLLPQLIFMSPRTPQSMTLLTAKVFVFCLLEFGVYGLLVLRILDRKDKKRLTSFMVTLLVLFCLPWFHMGYYNDLAMRASIPSLFVLSIFVVDSVFRKSQRYIYRTLLVAALALGAITPLVPIAVDLTLFPGTPRVTEEGNLWSVHQKYASEFPFIIQYIGSQDSWFFKYLSRPLAAAPQPPLTKPDQGFCKEH